MKKILLLIIVQTLFKWASCQFQDSIKFTIDSSDFVIPYSEKKGLIYMQPVTLQRTEWIISSLITSMNDYRTLCAAYEAKDSIRTHTETALRQVIITQENHLQFKQETIENIDKLLVTCTTNVDLLLQENKKQRNNAAFRQIFGITGGVLVGFAVGFLVCF